VCVCVSFAVDSSLLGHNALSFRKQLCYRIAEGFKTFTEALSASDLKSSRVHENVSSSSHVYYFPNM